MGEQVVVRYIWWQRWDNDNYRIGVALPKFLFTRFVCVLSLRVETSQRGKYCHGERLDVYAFKTSLAVELAFTAMRFDTSLSVEVKQLVCG